MSKDLMYSTTQFQNHIGQAVMWGLINVLFVGFLLWFILDCCRTINWFVILCLQLRFIPHIQTYWMSLKFCRSTMTCQQKGIQLLKFIVLLLALVETFTDSVIDCIIYTVDFNANSPTSASILHYCIGAYYLPNKRFYKVIIVLYVPALCLWRVRSRSSGHPSVQQAPNDGDEYNASLLKTPLRPAALVSHVALYIRNVPGNAWLQRILNSYMPGWKISKQQIDEFYLSEDNNGDELILSSEIWNHQSKFFNEESVQTRFLSWTEQHRQEHNSTIVSKSDFICPKSVFWVFTI